MRRVLSGIVGMLLGATAGCYAPRLLIPRPHEFGLIGVLGWWMVLIPLGAIVGLALGLSIGKQPPSS